MSASETSDGRKRTAVDIDADNQRPNKMARGDAADDDEDDLSFLLELRRKSGEIIQLPKRKSRKERLAALLKKKRPDAMEDDEPEDKEDAATDAEEEGPSFAPPAESIWRALELLDYEMVRAWVDFDHTCMQERDEELRQPLCVALELDFERAVRLFIKRGAPLLDIDAQGWSCLHYAVSEYARLPSNLLPHLLRHTSIPVNLPARDGACPIHLVQSDKPLKWLLGCGADPSLLLPPSPDTSGPSRSQSLKELVAKWGAPKKQKRALAMLSLAPYQAYELEKMRFVLDAFGATGSPDDHVFAARIQGTEVAVDDGPTDSWPVCWEEVPGQVYGLQRHGQLYLVRLESAVQQEAFTGGGAVPLSSLLRVGAEEFDAQGMRSPSSLGTTEEDLRSNSGAASCTSSPMRVEPDMAVTSMVMEQEEGQGQVDDEPWVLLEPLPRVELHHNWEQTGGTDSLHFVSNVLREGLEHLSRELFDEMLAYLW